MRRYNLTGAYEYTVVWPTCEVLDPLDRAIVLADGFVKFDTDPFADLEGGRTDESDYTATLRGCYDGPKLWIHRRCYEDMDGVIYEFGVV